VALPNTSADENTFLTSHCQIRILPCHVCRWAARTIQVRTGHGWYGGYYSRFNIDEDTTCPCDLENQTGQTRWHILQDCPLLADARSKYLLQRDRFRTELPALSMQPGMLIANKKLRLFLQATDAFFTEVKHSAVK
jgi:hypothetical protein